MSHIFEERFHTDTGLQGNIIFNEHLVRYRLASRLVSGKKVLDIACGSGYGSKILAEAGGLVTGMDISGEAIANAEKFFSHQNITYKVGSGESLEFENEFFDVVVSFETIEHLENPEKYLKELSRVIKKEGMVLISTPNKEVFGQQNPYHLKEYTRDEFQSEVEKHFSNVQIINQGNVMASVIDLGGRSEDVSITGNIKTLYFIAACAHSSLEGRLPVENFYSLNGPALDNLYNNPGFKAVNKIYTLATKIPGVKRVFEKIRK